MKNVVLLLLAVFAFTPFLNFGVPKKRKWVAFGLGAVSVMAVCLYSLRHLPLLDFTAFAPGAELFAAIDAPAVEDHAATFVYEKDGKVASFPLDNLPDSSWTFLRVDRGIPGETVRADAHPILSFRDADGVYQDELAVQEKTVVFSVFKPRKVNWERLQRQYDAVKKAGATPLVLVFDAPESGIPSTLPVFHADYKTLITLNRANGGSTYFDKGELVRKWTPRGFPEDPSPVLFADPLDTGTDYVQSGRIRAQGFCLYLAALLLLL